MLVCEHASRHIPAGYGGLGLSDAEQAAHIGWDLGALPLAIAVADLLDAPLVHATYSRLLLDVNRPVDAIDSIVEQSESTPVPGNAALDAAERSHRRERIYGPFHAFLESLLAQRMADGTAPTVVSIHSFTPRYHGVDRPWHCGVIARRDRALGEALLAALRADRDLCVGDNLPYGPDDGVFHSMERHAESRGLHGAMIEVRNDLLDGDAAVAAWAARIASALRTARAALPATPPTPANAGPGAAMSDRRAFHSDTHPRPTGTGNNA